MNKLGANIPYPYDVPLITRDKYIGLWTLSGFAEELEAELERLSKNPPKAGGLTFSFDTGYPEET